MCFGIGQPDRSHIKHAGIGNDGFFTRQHTDFWRLQKSDKSRHKKTTPRTLYTGTMHTGHTPSMETSFTNRSHRQRPCPERFIPMRMHPGRRNDKHNQPRPNVGADTLIAQENRPPVRLQVSHMYMKPVM